MKLPIKYQVNGKLINLVAEINACLILIKERKIRPEIKDRVTHLNLLKSSLYSARIEGNSLTLKELQNKEQTKQKDEVRRIIMAIKYLKKNAQKKITQKLILKLQELALSTTVGFRKEPSAIFNSAGIAVYMTVSPTEISANIKDLLDYLNSENEELIYFKAMLAHLYFEKIHPFLDGNGRVGRLLIYAILKRNNNLFVPFEEELEKNKDNYYYFLEIGLQEPERYLEFMLECYLTAVKKILKDFEYYTNKKIRANLSFRQEEILEIVKDHEIVSFDFLQRRFFKIPARTLRYDLKKLVDKKLLKKYGVTKGASYKIW